LKKEIELANPDELKQLEEKLKHVIAVLDSNGQAVFLTKAPHHGALALIVEV